MGKREIISKLKIKRPESNIFLIPLVCLALLVLFFPYPVVDWKLSVCEGWTTIRDSICISKKMAFDYVPLFFDRVLCVKLWYGEVELLYPHVAFPPPITGDEPYDARPQHVPSCPFKLDLAPYTQKLQL